MKSKKNKNLYFFVDESGDPYFYDRYGNFIVGKPGCSKILLRKNVFALNKISPL